MSKLAITLADKIKYDIGLVCDPETFRRTYAGCNQKAGGAWTWAMKKNLIPTRESEVSGGLRNVSGKAAGCIWISMVPS